MKRRGCIISCQIIIFLCCGILVFAICKAKKENIQYGPDESNKSLFREAAYLEEGQIEEKVIHFSIDDFIIVFEDLTINESIYNSIFDNSTLAWMKKMNNQYGVTFTCYVYFEKTNFNLDNCTRKFCEEFNENSDWLRFGFHSINENTIYGNSQQNIISDYEKTIDCLCEIVSEDSIDNIIRLHGFQGTESEISELMRVTREPIVGLLTADDDRKSYYLDTQENDYIYSHDIYFDEELRLFFISTDCRIEFIGSVAEKVEEFKGEAWNNQLSYLELFTHEWILNDVQKQKIEEFCVYAQNEGYISIFYEDIIYELE